MERQIGVGLLQHVLDLRQLLPLLSVAGKEKPWGKVERGAMKGKILAMAERHGPPSVFLTVSPDDVHQTLTVRLSHPSESPTGFPSFACDNDEPKAAALLEALRRRGTYREGPSSCCVCGTNCWIG